MEQPNPYAPTSIDTSIPPSLAVGELGQDATRSERFAGAFIDGILQLLLVIPCAVVFGLAMGALLGDGFLSGIVSQVGGGILGIGGFLLINGYLLATQGRTVGKLVMKTRIVSRETGELVPFAPLVLKRYLWLWLLAMIPYIGGVVGLIDSVLIFRANRACLHDDFAGTRVIKG
ncbi:RDD family protein [Aureliella helgolandensis]|nr:RDD family protein [Aureliella helgolandensis]